MTEIAFIGLGNMGMPMALNLVKAGHHVRGFDLNPDSRARFAADGGVAAASVGEAIADAPVIVTMLPAGPEVRAVYQGESGLIATASGGALLIDCSTIDVDTARAVAAEAEAAGLVMLDAPVSGGTMGAAAGSLTFMVGGGAEAFGRAKPLLDAMGKTIVHCGGPGNGQAAKICNNLILGISMLGVSEAFTLAEKLGLDAQTLFDITSKSSGQCWAITSYCPVPGPVPTAPSNNQFKPGFAAAMMAKDLKLAQQAALSAGQISTLGAEASALFSLYCNAGHGDKDFSAIITMIRGD